MNAQLRMLHLLSKIVNREYLKHLSTSIKNVRSLAQFKVNADNLENLIEKYDDKIIYSDYLENKRLRFGYRKNKAIYEKQEGKIKKLLEKIQSIQPLPVSLKYMQNDFQKEECNSKLVNIIVEEKQVQFPFATKDINLNKEHETNHKGDLNENEINEIKSEIKKRMELSVENKNICNDSTNINNWMTDYDTYDDTLQNFDNEVNYGSADPKAEISNVPCGGCGAFLHCNDHSIPGFIPKEIYQNCGKPGATPLTGIICQRCYFLKNYNLALQVRVSPDDYPKVLKSINLKKSLVVLIVDLLDFPCSIWPGMPDLFDSKQPFIIVGNKIDLLPQDGPGFINRITNCLKENLLLSGFANANIKHIALISAKTGFGVEDLITKLHSIWQYKGDVFLIGCTNVGKSSLFNALLQSDYCKIKAGDLIQRATTSVWPGTTLNLLKFPILRPSGWRLYVRNKRLQSYYKILKEEQKLRRSQLRTTRDPKYASLYGRIERSFTEHVEGKAIESKDPFSVNHNSTNVKPIKMGIDDKDPMYILNKWCYDTPGVVHPDQIIHLLTAEELLKTLSKELIRPKTFSIKPGYTVFLGGIARLDFIEGPSTAKITVFCAKTLPITMCYTEDAGGIYEKFLGSDMFAVPVGNYERLKQWPGLEAYKKNITVTGSQKEESCGDIVLSCAGWISITCDTQKQCTFLPWTPEGRGIYLRSSLLPFAVKLRGRKIRFSPAYVSNKFYIE